MCYMLDLDLGGPMEVQFSEPDFYDLDGYDDSADNIVAPFIDLLPEESYKEEGSPLKFKPLEEGGSHLRFKTKGR